MFMQLSSTGNLGSSAPKTKAYVALKDAASRSKSLRLASVAAAVRMSAAGHFDKVIEKIDEMIATLQEEAAEDLKQRDDCKDNYHKLALQKADIEWKIQKNEAAIVKIEDQITKIEDAIKETQEQQKLTEKELEDMEKVRTEENDAFKQAKTDDENAIKLLEEAIEALSAYYKDNKIDLGPIQGSVKLLQEPEFDKGDQAPDADFQKKGHRKNQSKGILSILTMIKEDLADEIKNAIKAEIQTQADYEKQVDAANTLLKNLKEKETNLNQDLTKQEQALLDENNDMDNNKGDLKTNEDEKESITEDCDWMIENFDERSKKRDIEKEGLVKAKEFLAGANPGGFLQH